MKYITKYRSPNYNSRKNSKIKLIIIHYTALKDYKYAISYLCSKEKKVSAHYLISQDGLVYALVEDKYRAWHAGQAYWQGITDINSISIGIELDYHPYGKNNRFTYKMLSSLKILLLQIKKKYKINKNNILAHSDVAPFRKKDPGEHFPWASLSSSKLILNFKKIKKNEIIVLEKWFNNYKIKSKKNIIIFSLSLLGYDTRQIHKNIKLYNKLISAYRVRYINKIDYAKKNIIYETVLKHLFKKMLTKN